MPMGECPRCFRLKNGLSVAGRAHKRASCVPDTLREQQGMAFKQKEPARALSNKVMRSSKGP